MISKLRQRSGSPNLTDPGFFNEEFSGEGDARQWVSLEIMGYFKVDDRQCLEFKVINKLNFRVDQLAISNAGDHEITIEVVDSINTQPTTKLFHLDLDFDPVGTTGWSITYDNRRNARKRTWKMTKAQAGVPPKK